MRAAQVFGPKGFDRKATESGGVGDWFFVDLAEVGEGGRARRHPMPVVSLGRLPAIVGLFVLLINHLELVHHDDSNECHDDPNGPHDDSIKS